ncbi:hypothetical protein NDU88_000081 [Pleurodeles waltl]|uniref:Uncharacterized protein n=1 Tax=Pleurodeles waltl TaxID=8319 RepID=A0AAV7U3K4_PLEWA|nr:hypothetical protein NDU88_000081 [Pleurodeles waltl]
MSRVGFQDQPEYPNLRNGQQGEANISKGSKGEICAAPVLSLDAQRYPGGEPPTEDQSNQAILATLRCLGIKMDNLQNTMKDLPAKVAGLMEQIWITKAHDYFKNGGTTVGRVRPEISRDCVGSRFPPVPLPLHQVDSSWCVQPVFRGGQNKSKQSAFADARRTPMSRSTHPPLTEQEIQCMQPVNAERHIQPEDLCKQPVFSHGHKPQQSHSTHPASTDVLDVEMRRCIQPVIIEGQRQKLNKWSKMDIVGRHKVQQSRPVPPVVTDGQGLASCFKLEPECVDEQGKGDLQALQQVFPDGQGKDGNYKLEPLSPDAQNAGQNSRLEPRSPATQGAHGSTPNTEADLLGERAATVDSVRGTSANQGLPHLRATSDNGAINKIERLQIKLTGWKVQSNSKCSEDDGQSPTTEPVKTLSQKQKDEMPEPSSRCGESLNPSLSQKHQSCCVEAHIGIHEKEYTVRCCLLYNRTGGAFIRRQCTLTLPPWTPLLGSNKDEKICSLNLTYNFPFLLGSCGYPISLKSKNMFLNRNVIGSIFSSVNLKIAKFVR